MPFMMVWPDSMSELTRKDGSSAASRCRPADIFSWSFLDFGSMAISMTGSGNVMVSSTTGLVGSDMVSPVVVSFMPARATMSPANASSISSRLFECIIIIRPTRSRLPLVELRMLSPFFRVPE